MEKIVLISDERYISCQVRYNMRQVCKEYFPDLEVSYFVEGQISMDRMLDSIYSFDIQKVGVLYYSWFQRNVLAGNKYLSSNNHRTISHFDKSPGLYVGRTWELLTGSLPGIFLFGIGFRTYRGQDGKGGSQ